VDWLDPMPLVNDISIAYKDYFTHQVSDKELHNSVSQFMMDRLRQVLSAATGINAIRQAKRYQYLKNEPVGKLFDVGCGAGGLSKLNA
jgi:hypothetical protein